jgi:putative heme transporter
VSGDASADRGPGTPKPRSRRKIWVIRIALAILLPIAGFYLIQLVGKVDWDNVGSALGDLAWWQPVVLVALLLVRQLLGAMPLSLYVPGVTPFRAVLNDQVGILLSSFAPPPSDLAARTAMFSSWGVPIPVGVAGVMLNTLTLFIVRFGAPAGAIVLSVATGAEIGAGWIDLLCIAGSVAILIAVLLIVRSDHLARTIGLTGGRLVHRVRHSVDPEAWATSCLRFRHDVAGTFQRGFLRATLATVGMLVTDCAMLVMSLRFVGLDAGEVGLAPIVIAYLFVFPLTLFPFFGLGLVDAGIVAAAVGAGGSEIEAAAVAGLIVWRVFNTGGPLLLGVLSLVGWRASANRSA